MVAFVALTLVLSIIALMLLNTSTAWFASNDTVDAMGMTVSVRDPGKIVGDVTFYNISEITLSENKKNNYTFEIDNITTTPKLDTFSALVALRQILIRIELTGEVDQVDVKAVTTSQGYIGATPSSIKQTDNPLSSVVAIYSASDLELTEGNSYVLLGDEVEVNVKHFVTKSGATFADGTNFTDTVNVYSTSDDGDSAIYIMLDYYEDSLEYILKLINGGGQTAAASGTNVGFSCDFELIISGK